MEMQDKMQNRETGASAVDWELSEDYYSEKEGGKKLSLEDFIDESSADLNMECGLGDDGAEGADGTGGAIQAELKRVAADVEKIIALSSQGRTAAEIAGELAVEEQYIKDIMVCVQAFPEDNPLAVARLIVMG